MNIIHNFPYPIIEEPHIWIDLPDGTRLAARLWRADTDEPLPAIVEYIPYRKSDGTAINDAAHYRYIAGHGYACLRVDVRGSGDSDGILTDEYSREELADGVDMLAWIAAQPWCNGKTALTGISWGGFNSLQIAALQPPSLAAVISVASTDDRYRDDVHYIGGTVLASDMLSWGVTFMTMNARPPHPAVVGDDWRDTWLKRLEHITPFVDTWLSHQQRDAYWQHGSICEDYAAIKVPTLLVGGWADGYTNTVLRMMGNLHCERKAIIGPWAHAWPEAASPGPRIGYLQEALRWWDHWLKGIDSGVDNEPALRFYADGWRQSDLSAPTQRRYRLGDGEVPCDLRHGSGAGSWCPFGARAQAPTEQSGEDATCLNFDLPVSRSEQMLLGEPLLQFETAGQQGHLVSRLCAISSDGDSQLISRGILKLSATGKQQLVMNTAGHILTPDSHLRLSLGRSYWPMVWPAPGTDALSISNLVLHIPVCADHTEMQGSFEAPEQAATIEFAYDGTPQYSRQVEPGASQYVVSESSASGRTTIKAVSNESESNDRYAVDLGKPTSATASVSRCYTCEVAGVETMVSSDAAMRADRYNFYLDISFAAFEDGDEVTSKTWSLSIPRHDY